MFKFLWNYFKTYKKIFLAVILCSILISVADLLTPYLTAKFIDEILTAGNVENFGNFIFAFFIISVAAIFSQWLCVILSKSMQIKTTKNLRKDVIAHVHRSDFKIISEIDMIYLSKRLEQDTTDLISFAVDNLTEFLTNFAVLCMAIFLLSSIGYKWTIIFLIIAVLHYFFYKFLEKTLLERSTAVRETESQYFNDFSENFLYIYSIKLQSLFNDYIAKFQNAFEKYFVAVLCETKINFWFMTSNLNANEIFKILIFLLGGIDVLYGEMSVGNFVALNGYYLLAMQAVSYFMNFGQNYQNALAAYFRIIEIKNFPQDLNGGRILENIYRVELKNICYEVGGRIIFKNFSQIFERGKVYCLVGKNGSGKTTLWNLICGLIKPAEGEIKFNNLPIAEIDMLEARKNLIAVVEQKDFLKNDSLSGGERRKISIKKAFAKSADLLILDEPDNNLDSGGLSELLQNILSDKENKITILISHDEKIFNVANEIIRLS